MELEKNNISNIAQQKYLTVEEQYEEDKKNMWKKGKAYVAEVIANKVGMELDKLEELVDCISNGQFLTRLYTKLKERNIDLIPHPEYKTKTVKDAETGMYMYKTGKYMSDFNTNTADDGLHIFSEARFNHHYDRAVDFILINKKGTFAKKYAIECQTNKGHLAPMEKHRDCVLGRFIALKTDYTFLEYSSYEIFGDSHISSIDELIDDLEFGNRNLFYNSRRSNALDSDFEF